MTIHVSATTGCNLGCTYCYENPDRERKQEWVDRQYDIEKIMEKLEDWRKKKPNVKPGMHGGEPLLVKKEDLERIFSWIDEHYDGGGHIQTNGTLLDEDHIEMFQKYNVHVGLSCDGPPELNSERKAAGERGTSSDKATAKMSERTQGSIESLVESGVGCGVITVLHKTNAGTEERFERLLDWLDWLNKNGVYGHFNPAIPYEDVQNDISLDPSVLKERYLRTWEWMKEEPYRSWGPMDDYIDNLLGLKLSNCVNNKCDVFNAGAAQIIKGNGETTGCGKTWSQVGDGVPFLQGDTTGNEYDSDEERYDMLKEVPGPYTDGDAPDMGGCKGCQYWNLCQGGCPSAGIDDDYRNRTIWCEAKYALYGKIESDLRAILPNITLVTDLPWDAEVSDAASGWNLDIKPFAAMRPDVEGQSSATGDGYTHPFGMPENRIPDEYTSEVSWDAQVEQYKEKYDEDELAIDEGRGYIHADSEMGESDEGWEEVDE